MFIRENLKSRVVYSKIVIIFVEAKNWRFRLKNIH